MRKMFGRVMRYLGRLRRHEASRGYIRHNREVFDSARQGARRGPEVLVELNGMQSSHIAYSYLAKVLAERHDAQIKGYSPHPISGTFAKVRFAANCLFGIEEYGVYQSFGVRTFLSIALSRRYMDKGRALAEELLPQLDDKRALENLAIDGVWVGDLIYDSYLMKFQVPTIELGSKHFSEFLAESVALYSYWKEYFDAHDVRGLIVSHCVYNIAIPLRIAASRGIDAFQANATHIYRIDQDRLFAYNDFFEFRERFAELPEAVRLAGKAEAARRIQRRFDGQVGVDMSYSTKSAYGASRHGQLLRPSERTKVLIATHCFFDSPHSYGNNLFPDFWEWLHFIGRLTKTTDYDWYIKTHPDFLPGNAAIIEGFLAEYPALALLPSDASHNQLIAEGIEAVLTVYGTIGFEYAAKNVLVINASTCNPHIAYGFNLHPDTVAKYEEYIRSIEVVKNSINIDIEEVYEYYFMKNIYESSDIFFQQYSEMLVEVGGYGGQFSDAVFGVWLREWTSDRHGKILSSLEAFVASGDFRMGDRHFRPSFTAAAMGRAA